MNNTIRNILIGLGILAVVIVAGFLFNGYKDRQMLKEKTLRVESEMRFKQLIIERVALDKQKDSISSLIAQKQVLIDYLENNPQTIIQQNNDSHLSIDRLNAINTALLWTNNITEYENSRERYSLSRFGKKSSQ